MRFGLMCDANDIGYRLTTPNGPWTNRPVERMSWILKDATVKRYSHDTHDQRRGHFNDVMGADNVARRLRTQTGLSP